MMAAFELNGDWTYTGGFDGLTETLAISETTMTDEGDYKGTAWIITYDISSRDNEADQALLVVTKTEGFSHYMVGEKIYMSWQLDQNVAKLYFAPGDYPVAAPAIDRRELNGRCGIGQTRRAVPCLCSR